MGCDGGTIPRRDELVRTKKKPEQKDKAMELSFRWQHCAVSQEMLRPPVVACELGRMYNKDAVIEAILDKDKPEIVSHIKSLKNMKELNLTDNPAYRQQAEKGDGSFVDVHKARWFCPISGIEMNGRFGFQFIWTCGCVLSQRAIQQIRDSNCLKCEKPFKEEDVVTLNPTDVELDRMGVRMEARRAREKAAKKNKRKQVPEEPAINKDESSKKSKPDLAITNGYSQSDKAHLNSNGFIPGSKVVKKTEAISETKGQSSYSVAKDPGASEAYKSLFTTHKDAQQKGSAHWITYNPFYN